MTRTVQMLQLITTLRLIISNHSSLAQQVTVLIRNLHLFEQIFLLTNKNVFF